jgi:dTDP-4-dehydrorhamnose 3,5-epimerase-like enzyme
MNDEKSANLRFEKEVEDIRGKILFFSYNNVQFNMVEIKKGYARGGHYHDFESRHIMIMGKIEYREENIKTGVENIRIISSPATIDVAPHMAHLLIALEDTIFTEIFESQYQAVNFPKYRNIVEEKMNFFPGNK